LQRTQKWLGEHNNSSKWVSLTFLEFSIWSECF